VMSEFKPPSHEMATVRVDMNGDQRAPLSSVDLVVTTPLYVNPLNATRPEDCSLPDPAKEETYVKAVKANLRDRLVGLCRDAQWRSERVLIYGLSPTMELPRLDLAV
jgi:hypothetical protein